jgi:hypothetical protein
MRWCVRFPAILLPWVAVPQVKVEGSLVGGRMKSLLMFLIFSVSCASATWDPAANFNAPNNPQASSVFSYGVGGNPNTFVPLSHLTLNCYGTPTYCEDSGGSIPTIPS